jgi:hypothetical protein
MLELALREPVWLGLVLRGIACWELVWFEISSWEPRCVGACDEGAGVAGLVL